ncbi:MAG: type II toxin-antitoxin system RelE/ParE family toxin [Myxococcales bacterium]|nr:type II toxin-antitoxin system RelE/ParE family toxin [Myxococcales bacterium]
MKLRYLKRARRQLREAIDWLQQHDMLEPFEAEFRRKTTVLKVTPYIGVPVPKTRLPGVRVIYLSTKHIIYYRVDERAGVVEVLRIWHTSRGHRPKL